MAMAEGRNDPNESEWTGGSEPPSEGERPVEGQQSRHEGVTPRKTPLPPERPAEGYALSRGEGDDGDEPSKAEADEASSAEEPKGEEPSGRERLIAGLWPPRVNRNQLVVALLLCVLGLGLAIQVRQTSEDSALRGARQEDLVRILDELDDRTTRLGDEKQRLEGQRSELENSSDQAEEARKQTEERERQLGVLAGTVAAEGPGIHFEIGDPEGAVEADKLLDAIQELRAAGAEAIEVNDVRVVADTYFSDVDDRVRVDGRKVTAPYRFDVIGKPQDLEPALNIPGGVVQTLQKEQATVTIEQSQKITVDALRTAKRPDYAQSSSQ